MTVGWAAEPIALIGLALLGLAYWRGLEVLWASAGRGQVVARWQAKVFAVALGVLVVALSPPLDVLAASLFSAHMAQHLLIGLVSAPLLVLGVPATVIPRALPDSGRRWIARWHGRLRRLSKAWPGLPVVGLLAFAAVWWAWHIPPLYDAALRSPALHAIEHTTMLASAIGFWAPVLRPRRTPVWAGPLLLLGAAAQSGILAALLVFSPRPFYSQLAAPFTSGLDPLSDQALAGVLMWVPGGFVYLLAAAMLFARWLDRDANASEEAIVHAT